MKNVLLTLTVLSVVTAPSAFAQRGRAKAPGVDSARPKVNETTEEARRRAKEATPGLKNAQSGRIAEDAANAKKTAIFTAVLKGDVAPGAKANLSAELLKLAAEKPVMQAFVDAVNENAGVAKIDVGGQMLNNADAAAILTASLSKAKLLNEAGTNNNNAGEFNFQQFAGVQILTILKGTSSKEFILTAVTAAKALDAGKSLKDAMYEAITRDATNKDSKWEEFCGACPGACK